MTGRDLSPQHRPAGHSTALPAVVKVRLSGGLDEVGALAAVLAAALAAGQHGELIEVSAPYPNRRDPGVRAYLTVRMTGPATAPGQQGRY